jgi:membrane protein DedA with SNARE-associated domain
VPDLTAPLVNWVTEVIGSYGVWAVFILMVLESACIPVPSEAIMLFGGFLAGQGKTTLFAVIVAGVAGNLVGSWIAYWVGLKKGRDWALQWHWLHITPERLDKADRWFDRYGSWAVLIARMLPIIRTFISFPAGVSRMPFWRFTILTVIGCIPWVTLLAWLGLLVGDNWEAVQHKLHYFDYAVALLIVAGIIWMLVRYRRRRAAA